MRHFKGRVKYWVFPMLVGIFLAVFGVRELRNKAAENILQMYLLEMKDPIILGLILPAVFLLFLKEADEFMVSGRLLAIGSRSAWWAVFCKKALAECLAVAVVIVLPAFLAAGMYRGSALWEWQYTLFLLFTFFLYFCLAVFCIMLLEIRFQQNILSVCFVFLLSFLPNIFAFLFRSSGIPRISGILSLAYALDASAFDSCRNHGPEIHCFRYAGVCASAFALLLVLKTAGRALIKRKDIFWK